MGNPYAPPGENPRTPDQPPTASGGGGPQPTGGPVPGAPDPAGPQGRPTGGAPQGRPVPHVPPQGSPAPGRPPGPAPDSEVMRATSRRVLHFLAFLLAAVVTSALPLPWQAASLVFLLVGMGVGIRALVIAWRGGIRGRLAGMLAVGVVMAGFVGIGMLSLLAVWPQQLERQECLARAVTISATRTCEADFRRAIEERLDPSGPTDDA